MKLFTHHLSPHLSAYDAEAEPIVEMNTTPLIDVLLVLIVMLIITITVPLNSISLDTPTKQTLAVQPDIVVESSLGRWHCYWLVSDCPLDKFKLRQQQLAAKFKSDSKVIDLPRVLRLPGFFHQKAEPFMTRVIFPEGCK